MTVTLLILFAVGCVAVTPAPVAEAPAAMSAPEQAASTPTPEPPEAAPTPPPPTATPVPSTPVAKSNSVTNGEHTIDILEVEKAPTLHGGMIKPRNPNDVFLVIYIKTDDPCFDESKNASCFDAGMTPLDKIVKACGAVQTEPGNTYFADGGGHIEGRLACNWTVPKNIDKATIRFTGYPDLASDF
jgi:hypothetical protein